MAILKKIILKDYEPIYEYSGSGIYVVNKREDFRLRLNDSYGNKVVMTPRQVTEAQSMEAVIFEEDETRLNNYIECLARNNFKLIPKN